MLDEVQVLRCAVLKAVRYEGVQNEDLTRTHNAEIAHRFHGQDDDVESVQRSRKALGGGRGASFMPGTAPAVCDWACR